MAPRWSSAHRDAMEKRRADVANMLDDGVSQRDIAKALGGVAVSTINSDIKRLRERWRKEQLRDVGDAMIQDLRRLDQLLVVLTNPVRSGDLPAIDRYLKVLERRARIYGYDAPSRLAGHAVVEIEDRADFNLENELATAPEAVRDAVLDFIVKRREFRQFLAEFDDCDPAIATLG